MNDHGRSRRAREPGAPSNRTPRDIERPSLPRQDRFTQTVHCEPSLKYVRYTALDAGGRRRILFKFDIAESETELISKVFTLMKGFQHTSGSNYSTGLKYINDQLHGRVWILPDHRLGRVIADRIDAELARLTETTARSDERNL